MIKYRLHALLALVLSLAALHVCAEFAGEPGLTTFDARYRIKMSGLRGDMQMSLAREGNRYTAKSWVIPRGLARLFARGQLAEHAEFSIVNNVLLPHEFESLDTLKKKGRKTTIGFERDPDLAKVVVGETNLEVPLDKPTFDRVSIQYALMLAMITGSTGADYVMLDGDDLKPLTVTYEPGHTIKVPFGNFAVTKVRHRSENSSRAMTLWCAEELGFLPVRIEQHKNNKRVARMDLTRFSPGH